MEQEIALQLDIEQVIKTKAPQMGNRIPKWLFCYLEKVICQEQMNDILFRFADKCGVEFAQALLNDLNVNIQIKGKENIPKNGRFIFASNHPLGGLDGIGLVSVLGEKYNSQIKFVVNDLLMNIKPLAPVFTPINKHGTQDKNTVDSLHKAFASDQQILMFPSGMVSRLQQGEIKDLEWKKMFINKATQYERDVIPVYFEGKNSMFFYRLAQFRKLAKIAFNIEMMFLPSELFKSKDKTFTVTFGKPIDWHTFSNSKPTIHWVKMVRNRVYELKKKNIHQ